MGKKYCNVSIPKKKFRKGDRSHFTNVGKHLLRQQQVAYNLANPAMGKDNEVLINMECETLSKSLNKFLKDNKIQTRNSQTVQAYQLVFSIPKECFGNKELIEEWKKATVKFVNENEITKDNCLLLVYHNDEVQPHIQAICVPRIGNTLNYKELLGGPYGPLKLSKLHDDYAKYHEPLGFTRGDGTHTKGLSASDYKKSVVELEKALPEPVALPPVVKKKVMGVLTNPMEVIKQLEEQNKIYKKENKKLRKQFGKSYFFERQNTVLQKANQEMKIKIRNNLMKMNKEQQEKLREIPCENVLEQLGYAVKKEGGGYRFKNDEFNIFISKGNKFYDNQSGQGGFGAISLLVDMLKYSFKDAVSYLANGYGLDRTTDTILSSKVISKAIIENSVDNIVAEMPKAVSKNIDKITDYLINKRKISKKLIDELISKNMLFADRNNNCVFTNEDKTFAFQRGTTDKKYVSCRGKMDFIKYDFGNPKEIYLFESAIDALSFRTMNPEKDGSYIVLNGSALINRTHELTDQADKVYLCFDNDDTGSKFCDKISGATVAPVEIIKPLGKDFNEDLANGDYSSTKRSTDISPRNPKTGLRIN